MKHSYFFISIVSLFFTINPMDFHETLQGQNNLLLNKDMVIEITLQLITSHTTFKSKIQAIESWKRTNRHIKFAIDSQDAQQKICHILFEKNHAIPNKLKKATPEEKATNILFHFATSQSSFVQITSDEILLAYCFLVKILKKMGGNINDDISDSTALYRAIQSGKFEFVKALLLNGADPNKGHIPTNMSPVMCASINGKADIFKLLVQHGADINKPDRYGNTLFSQYYWPNHIPIYQIEKIINEVATEKNMSQKKSWIKKIYNFFCCKKKG